MQKDKFPELQQYLPFTVLKLFSHYLFSLLKSKVATVLTVYGIETGYVMNVIIFRTTCVATVLTVYGIETDLQNPFLLHLQGCNSTYRLRY